MKFTNYAQPIDIAQRLLRRKQIWPNGKPTINLTGKEGEFGELIFNFQDKIVTFRIYIANEKQILDAAHSAVDNFAELAQEIYSLYER